MKANRKKRKAGKRSKAQFCFNLVLACFALIVVLIAGVYVGIRRSNVKPVLARSALKSPETSILSENDDNVQAEIRIRDETIASQAKEIAANDAAIEELRRRQEGDLLQIPLQNSQPAAIASATSTSSGVIIESAVNYDVHAFYYGWYGSPSYDPEKTGWVHWNHPFLEHWDRNVAKQWPQGIHDPDKRDIGSDYWPKLGPYASSDPEVLKNHVQWAARSGIGVLVLSCMYHSLTSATAHHGPSIDLSPIFHKHIVPFCLARSLTDLPPCRIFCSGYPPGKADENGRPSDPMVRPLLDAALTAGLKVALHLEPYRGRNALSVRDDITYAVSQYGDHPALHRMQRRSATPFKGTGAEARSSYLPVFYIYDSYHTAPKEWSKVLAPAGPFSIRRTAADAFVLFLFVEPSHATYASSSIGFDGFYRNFIDFLFFCRFS